MLSPLQFESVDLSRLQLLASSCAAMLSGGDVVFFKASLGAGKTTMVRSMLHALGYQGVVKSPTYGIVECYDVTAEFSVVHCDLYRLQDPEALYNIGFNDYIGPDNLILIEWPERCQSALPPASLEVIIDFQQADLRKVLLDAKTESLRKKLYSTLTAV